MPGNVMVVVVRTLPRLLSRDRWAIFLVPPAKSVKVGETRSGYTVCSWPLGLVMAWWVDPHGDGQFPRHGWFG